MHKGDHVSNSCYGYEDDRYVIYVYIQIRVLVHLLILSFSSAYV